MKPWEMDEVPLYWRNVAREADYAEKEARQHLASKGKAMVVYPIE